MQEKKLEEIINELPEDLRKELEDFAQFLWEKNKKRKIRRKSKFDWACSLSDLANDFSSVELQHKISDWRIGKK
ncbi:MAG: DUF2281 domain-containing protein [Candidatus Calescibacterium sp.]|jgi:hypothetical protein